MSRLRIIAVSAALALTLVLIGPTLSGVVPASANGPVMHHSSMAVPMIFPHNGNFLRFDPDRDHDFGRVPINTCFNFCVNGFQPFGFFGFNGCPFNNPDCRMDARCIRFLLRHDRDDTPMRLVQDLRSC
jgi:hypothetical protein